MSVVGVRRAKAALSSGCKPHPANAPAGSDRSSHGGNEVAEASTHQRTPLRYEEAKLLSGGSVDEQDGGMIRGITFLYYIGWDDFPLAILPKRKLGLGSS